METIYIPLLNEGSPCARPTSGRLLSDGTYEVLPTINYAPTDEEWKFPPGSIVRCRKEMHGVGLEKSEVLVAFEKISEV